MLIGSTAGKSAGSRFASGATPFQTPPRSDGHREAPRNWISTAGYNEGILFARWLLADSLPDTPSVEVCHW